MPEATAYAVHAADAPFEKITLRRREPGPTDVLFDVKYCGICHSDIHTARSEWSPATYPLVPGHELAGIVREVGSEVKGFQPGDRVGVGCFVDSCGECDECKAGEEQRCRRGMVATYGGPSPDGDQTQGGYSDAITVDQDYLLRVPDGLDLAAAAPLMCAGITTYRPLKHWGVGPGKKVGIVGMGGLGHVGVKIAAAMGADVAVVSQTRSKEEDGRRFGASEWFPLSEDGTADRARGQFDVLLCTVGSETDMSQYLAMLANDGVLINVGLPTEPLEIPAFALAIGDKVLAGSMIGGIAQTQEMLDFCAEHDVTAQIEIIGGEDITAAYDRVVDSDVKYRFVIDTSTFTR